jgi:hypothetical protein
MLIPFLRRIAIASERVKQTGRPVEIGDKAVNLDDGGVDHRAFHVGFIRDGIEKPFENIGFLSNRDTA